MDLVAVGDNTVVRVMLADLYDWYPKISDELIPSSGSREGATSKNPPGPKLPLRVDVMDLILGLQHDALHWESKARVALVFNVRPDKNVQRALKWLSDSLDALSDEFVAEIEPVVSRYHYQISVLTGKIDRPPKIGQIDCPYCNQRLTVLLQQALIICRNRACRCSSSDCKCQNGKGHFWPETEWLMLGKMISILDSLKADAPKTPDL